MMRSAFPENPYLLELEESIEPDDFSIGCLEIPPSAVVPIMDADLPLSGELRTFMFAAWGTFKEAEGLDPEHRDMPYSYFVHHCAYMTWGPAPGKNH
jgi:hypothetical protein